MPIYFLSDVHLRRDHPERSRRLKRFVDRLNPDDRLIIVGDLSDFWFCSRQNPHPENRCEGLESLRQFQERGGRLSLLPGNHDASLDGYYRSIFGDVCLPLAVEILESGTRIHVTHGHTIGARSFWKAWMESRAFLALFRFTPSFLATRMDRLLNAANEVERDAINRKHLDKFRAHASTLAPRVDLAIFGHVHQVYRDSASPRMIVLGGWHHRTSYLRIHEGQEEIFVEDDPPDASASELVWTSGGASS